MNDLTIIMPVYNELQTLEAAVADALETEFPVPLRELIIVDDGSTDGTRELIRNNDWPDPVRVFYHERNLGKGSALQTGLQKAEGEFCAILDADLEYEAASISDLLPTLVAGHAEAVYGVRGFQSHSAFSFWYVVGNKAVTFASNLIFNSWLSDIMTCHKVARTETMRLLNLTERGFAIEPEITARLLQSGARIYEVPVVYTARAREDGKKLTSADGVRVLRTLVRCRLTPNRVRPIAHQPATERSVDLV